MSTKLPRPFLGRLLVEAIEVRADEHLKKQTTEELAKQGKVIDKEFMDKFVIANATTETDEFGKKTLRVNNTAKAPIQKGKILEMAPDAFGERFKEVCGADVGVTPNVGDVIYFIPNDTYRIDPAGRFHFVNDSQVCGIE